MQKGPKVCCSSSTCCTKTTGLVDEKVCFHEPEMILIEPYYLIDTYAGSLRLHHLSGRDRI